MPILRTVEAWPATRFPDRRWDPDADLDAFLGASRAVFEVVSEELAGAGITTRSSTVRFFPRVRVDPAGEFKVGLHPRDYPDGADSAQVTVPGRFAALGEDDRAWACLAVIHTGVLELGRLRGWDTAPLAAVRERVVARGLRFTWAGAWKAGPGRRHRARCAYRIAGDGLGRVQLEVQATADGQTVARTEEAVAFSTVEGFRRSAATLRWRDRDTVTAVPWCGLGREDYRGLLEVDLRAGAPPAPEVPAPPAAPPGPLPPVRVHLLPPDGADPDLDAHPAPCVQWDGAWEHDWPPAYIHEVKRVLDLLGYDPAYQQWWAGTPFTILLLRLVLDTGEAEPPWTSGLERWPRPGTRKVGVDLRLTVRKPAGELPDRQDATAQRAAARHDVHRALADAARGRGFPDPPPLPERVSMNRRQWQAAKHADTDPGTPAPP